METVKQFSAKVGSHLKRNIKRYIAVVLAIAIAVGAGGYMMRKRQMEAMAANARTPSFIRTTRLEKTTLSDSISATGIIESANVSNVTTTLKSAVKSVSVAVGDYVKEGDVICTLDTADLEKQITRAQEKLQESINAAQEKYDLALEKYEEGQETYEDYYDDYDDARDAYRAVRDEYQAAEAALVSYNDDLAAAQKALQKASGELIDAQTAVKKAKSVLEDAEADLSDAEAELSGLDSTAEDYDTLKAAAEQAVADAEDAVEAAEKAVEDSEAEEADVQTVYDEAESDCKEAEDNLELKQNALNFTALEKDYNTKLSAYESASEKYEKYETTLEDLEDAVADAKEALEEAQESEDLEDLYDSLENYTLKAETSGYVTSLNATVGSIPAENNVATIQDTEDLVIAISIAEYDIDSVELGMRAIITSDSIDGSVEGELTQIAPIASGGMSSSATFAAEVSVLGGSNGLIIGVNAKVELILSSTEDVFVVPIDAVGTNADGESIVYVKTGGNGVDATFDEIVITTGESNDYYVEISGDSLKEGMEVRSSADLTEATFTTSQEDAQGENSGFPMGGGMNMGGMPAAGMNTGGNRGGMPTGGMPGGNMGGRP